MLKKWTTDMLTRALRQMHRMPMGRLPAPPSPAGGIRSFRWDASTGSPTPDGYRLYWGTSAGTYVGGPHLDAGTPLEELYTALGLSADTTYYVVARAYAGAQESGNSNEIQVRNGVQIGP